MADQVKYAIHQLKNNPEQLRMNIFQSLDSRLEKVSQHKLMKLASGVSSKESSLSFQPTFLTQED